MDKPSREMTFEEEAKLYEKEACAEFAKETGNDDCSAVNGILRRGIRIIRKARQELAKREEVVLCKYCIHRHSSEFCECRPEDGFCNDGERKDNETN